MIVLTLSTSRWYSLTSCFCKRSPLCRLIFNLILFIKNLIKASLLSAIDFMLPFAQLNGTVQRNNIHSSNNRTASTSPIDISYIYDQDLSLSLMKQMRLMYDSLAHLKDPYRAPLTGWFNQQPTPPPTNN